MGVEVGVGVGECSWVRKRKECGLRWILGGSDSKQVSRMLGSCGMSFPPILLYYHPVRDCKLPSLRHTLTNATTVMARKRKRAVDDRAVHDDAQEFPQPDVAGACRYNFREDLPWDCQRYWRNRFEIFSLYNQGVWMTGDSWFEVTPEAIANTIAAHVTASITDNRSIIVDAFCGIGGNTIAFARSGRFKRVYAIEKNEAALACAKRNAEIYGVADKITWFRGDCFEILGSGENPNSVNALREVIRQFGVIFGSPPWGGPGYKTAEVFDLAQMQPYSIDDMYGQFSQITKNVVLYLPRTSDLTQIAKYVEEGQKSQIVHYCTHGGSRALCAYLGDWKPINVEMAPE